MPTLAVRYSQEVPPLSRASKADRERQSAYDAFIREVGADSVGELSLETDESVRSVKVRLRRAANRSNATLEIWDHSGKVYFRQAAKAARNRKSP